jgi:hypothetical protein
MGASTTMATVDSILKEIYEPKLQDQLQSEVLTLRRIEKTSEGVSNDVGGKYVVFPIRTRRNHGIGARNENEPLPDPKTQKYAAARVPLKYLYGLISLTGQTMKLANTNTQAFASALSEEVDGMKETLAKDMNRQVYGTSKGILASIPTGSVSAQTTQVVANAQYMEPGMIVDVLSSDGTVTRASKVEVTDVSGTTITFGSSFDTADNDIITRWRSYNKEVVGFEEIVSDTGTLFNIDPTVEPVWKSTINHNSGTNRALSEGMMIKMIDDIRTKGGKTTVIFTTLGVRRSYFNLLTQQRRYAGETKKFPGGFEGLSFTTDSGETPLISDYDCQPNRMYFINEKKIKLYREGDWEFMDYDGSKWQRVITSEGRFDAYEATLYKYCEIGTHQRNSHGLIKDITEAS